jgi:hypothetical protein
MLVLLISLIFTSDIDIPLIAFNLAQQRRQKCLLVFINLALVLDSNILITYTSSFIIPGCHPLRWRLKVFNGLFIVSCG